MKNVLIIGLGEIGSPIAQIIEESRKYNTFKKDIRDLEIKGKIDIMHICIPYSEKFVDIVLHYIKKYNPDLTIINSTVRPGTTNQIFSKTRKNIVHSPVRGKHPKMKAGILLFVKFIGPANEKSAKSAEEHFSELGIKTETLRSPIETELGKVLDTTYYGLSIAFHQDMERICKKFNADFEQSVTRFNITYNDGCKITNPNVVRPVLFPGFIGGHCIMPNIDILKLDIKSDFLNAIVESNKIKEKEIKNAK